jgi:hypothetical protein
MEILMHEQLEPFFSARLEQKMSDRGKIIKAPDFESIFSDNPAMQEQMGGMNKQMESMFVEYPEKALKIGESFNYGLKNDEVTYTSVLTLTEVTDTEYIFKITGDVSASSGGQDVTGTMTGTQTFFRESCMPKSSDMTVRMEVSGMTMTMETSMEVEKY